MTRLAAAVAVLVLGVVAACGSESEPRPAAANGAGDAVTKLLTAIEDGSCPDVKAVVVTPDAIDCEQIQDLEGSYSDQGIALDDIGVTTGTIHGGSTTVTVDLGIDDPDETWQAERVGGTWRVLFDSEE